MGFFLAKLGASTAAAMGFSPSDTDSTVMTQQPGQNLVSMIGSPNIEPLSDSPFLAMLSFVDHRLGEPRKSVREEPRAAPLPPRILGLPRVAVIRVGRFVSTSVQEADVTSPARQGLIIASVFFVGALALSGVLPLWLDEVMQLIETRDKSASELLATLPSTNTGAVPLGYLIQHAALRITGYSVRRARFPAAFFGSGAVFLVALLGAELGVSPAWLGAVIFAAFPLSVRYATESRVYSQALFFSLVASFTYIHLTKRPNVWTGVIYCLTLALAVYSQPFSAFVGLAHIVWSIANGDRRTALLGASGFGLATLAFMPWYLWSRSEWQTSIARAGLHSSVSEKTVLMVFRELAGAGYWGSGLLLLLCILAAVGALSRPNLRFLILCIVIPLLCGLGADAAFGYFIAARQFIWLLPMVAILASAAVMRSKPTGLTLITLLVVVCFVYNIYYFTAPHEDWQAAADVLANETKQGACLVVVPNDQARYYEFFRKQLHATRCHASRVVVSATPYATSQDFQAAIADLAALGYKQESDTMVGKSHIMAFSRPN